MPQAAPSNSGSTVTRRNPPTIWDMTVNGFSQISVAEPGRLAFLSGQVASPAAGTALPGDVAGQAPMAVANLAAALDELGASARDIVMLRLYVVEATTERFRQALSALRELLGSAMPSVTTIGVQALYTPGLQLEIEMVVRVP